ncbi:MAG: hypothetical protein ACJ75J_15155 [Cytophagaceae bacterium]
MKTIYYSISILMVLFTLTSCKHEPEEVVEEYLDMTFLNNNGRKAYQLLSSDDKLYKSEKEFIAETKKKNILSDNILDKYKDQFYYQIIESRKNGDTTLIKVSLTHPDADDVLHDMISFAMVSAFSKKSVEEKNQAMDQKLAELLKNKELETVTEEREFRVIREKDQYKLYLNLGLPRKMEKMRAELEKLNAQAEEELRVINFEGALTIYRKMLSLQYNEKVQQRIAEIETIKRNTVNLGEKIHAGHIIFTPKMAEVRKVTIAKTNWYGGLPHESLSYDDHFVLSYEISNKSEGQVFAHDDESKYRKEHVVHDNFGNVMTEFALDYDMEHVEGNTYRKLEPGETRMVKAVCEAPLSKTANEFLWQVKLYTDNKKSCEYIYIRFAKDEIKFESMAAGKPAQISLK